jgi:hypothetical protein
MAAMRALVTSPTYHPTRAYLDSRRVPWWCGDGTESKSYLVTEASLARVPSSSSAARDNLGASGISGLECSRKKDAEIAQGSIHNVTREVHCQATTAGNRPFPTWPPC